MYAITAASLHGSTEGTTEATAQVAYSLSPQAAHWHLLQVKEPLL